MSLEVEKIKRENLELNNKWNDFNIKWLMLDNENNDLIVKYSKIKKELSDILNKHKQWSPKRNTLIKYSSSQAVTEKEYPDYKQPQNEIQLGNNEIKNLKTLLKSKEDIIDSLSMRLQKYLSVNSNVKYYDYYSTLLAKLKELFEWPLSLDYLEKPTILPSGFTINENIFDRLINNKDPYNKNLNVQHKITNRFANEVREIISSSENSVIEEEKKIQEEIKEVESLHLAKGTQTDSQYIFDKDCKQIEDTNQIIQDILDENQKNLELINKFKHDVVNNNQDKLNITHQIFEDEVKIDSNISKANQSTWLSMKNLRSEYSDKEENKEYKENSHNLTHSINDSSFPNIKSRYVNK